MNTYLLFQYLHTWACDEQLMLHYYCVVLSNMDVSVLLQQNVSKCQRKQKYNSVLSGPCVLVSQYPCSYWREYLLSSTTTTASTTNLCWCHTCRIAMQQNIQQYKAWIKLD